MKWSLGGAALLAALCIPSHASIDVQFAPGADARGYRKVLVAPAQVEFQREFLSEVRTSRSPTHRLRPEEIRELAREMGDDFARALVEAFKRRGFEVASAPASDVLRVTPTLKNLYLNAPDARVAGMHRTYVREAGGALMAAEVSTAVGAKVASAAEESTTSRSLTFELANRVTNRFWFEAMFRTWADDFAEAIAARK